MKRSGNKRWANGGIQISFPLLSPCRFPRFEKTTLPKVILEPQGQPFINGCFNWIIPNLYIENGCFTKHPFINGWPWGSRREKTATTKELIPLCCTGHRFRAKRFGHLFKGRFSLVAHVLGERAPIRSLQMGLKWGRYKWPYLESYLESRWCPIFKAAYSCWF